MTTTSGSTSLRSNHSKHAWFSDQWEKKTKVTWRGLTWFSRALQKSRFYFALWLVHSIIHYCSDWFVILLAFSVIGQLYDSHRKYSIALHILVNTTVSLTDTHILAALNGFEIVSISLAASINKLFTLVRCGIEEVMWKITEARSSIRWKVTNWKKEYRVHKTTEIMAFEHSEYQIQRKPPLDRANLMLAGKVLFNAFLPHGPTCLSFKVFRFSGLQASICKWHLLL